MKYSSIIELIGVKDLAEDDPEEFSRRIINFMTTIKSCVAKMTKESEVHLELYRIHFFRDYCYVESNNIEKLIDYIVLLREELFKNQNAIFRSVVYPEGLELKNSVSENILKGKNKTQSEFIPYGISRIATKLYGILERFKGAGIYCDELYVYLDIQIKDLNTLIWEEIKRANNSDNVSFEEVEKSRKILLEQVEQLSRIKERLFINFYIVDINTKRNNTYYDVRIDTKGSLLSKTSSVILELIRVRRISKKVARFYIPLLLNIFKFSDLSTRGIEISPVESTHNNDDTKNLAKIRLIEPWVNVTTSNFGKGLEVPGFDLVFAMIISKVTTNISWSLDKNKSLELLKFNLSQIENQYKILSDTKHHIPDSILDLKNRRKALSGMIFYLK